MESARDDSYGNDRHRRADGQILWYLVEPQPGASGNFLPAPAQRCDGSALGVPQERG